MIEEELGEKGEIFAIDWILQPIYFEHRHLTLAIPINLITGWMIERTLETVSQ